MTPARGVLGYPPCRLMRQADCHHTLSLSSHSPAFLRRFLSLSYIRLLCLLLPFLFLLTLLQPKCCRYLSPDFTEKIRDALATDGYKGVLSLAFDLYLCILTVFEALFILSNASFSTLATSFSLLSAT